MDGCLELSVPKLANSVVNSERAVNTVFADLTELFNSRLRNFTYDAVSSFYIYKLMAFS